MNYYGSAKFLNDIKDLDENVFSRIDLSEPSWIKEMEDGYAVKCFYYADIEHCVPGYAPKDGEIRTMRPAI